MQSLCSEQFNPVSCECLHNSLVVEVFTKNFPQARDSWVLFIFQFWIFNRIHAKTSFNKITYLQPIPRQGVGDLGGGQIGKFSIYLGKNAKNAIFENFLGGDVLSHPGLLPRYATAKSICKCVFCTNLLIKFTWLAHIPKCLLIIAK